MKQITKLLIVDPDDKYLLLYRSNHPEYGDDPDLPGGIVENDETLLEATFREVMEEIGVVVDSAQELYSSTEYSEHGNSYSLYITKLDHRPEIMLSWEHLSYEWLPRQEFLEKSLAANDSYMHMVHEAVMTQFSLPDAT